MPRTVRARAERLRTEALLVRSAPFGDADLMVTFFTEARGIVTAAGRAARRSQKRFPALEPIHLLRVSLEDRPGHEVATLVESAIVQPRMGITASLARMEAAGQALRWVRRASPPGTPEPELWMDVNEVLDRLDAREESPSPGALVAAMGLRLLAHVGWGMDLERCVRCGRVCEAGAAAYVDAGQGGLVCRACGGARLLLRGEMREKLLAALNGEDAALGEDEVKMAVEIVEAAMAAHM